MDHVAKHNIMKVLQTISGLSAQSGGPSTCTCDLMKGLHDIGTNVDLLTVSSSDILGKNEPWLISVPNDCKTPLGLSNNIRSTLEGSDYDLYHANALWAYSTHITCKTARQKGKPYILSPHGMLYPTALSMKKWKKWSMLRLWFYKDIYQASCLHATCQQEAEYCRQFGYKGPIAVIPNCVVLPQGVNLKTSIYEVEGRRQIGFLGRLHPIKNVENIIYALGKLTPSQREHISFQIMGKYDDRYESWLKEEVKRIGVEANVEFVGFVSGKEKYDRLTKLTALMVPSKQENFGMIVPEALICGTPVYASLGTPWNELNDCHCGWWRDNEPSTIANIICEILKMDESELLAMGRRGRKLIEENYEQHKVAGMMNTLYRWIVEDKMKISKKPQFVNTL